MNGTDHTAPDERLTARINEAREISAMTFETGSLETYVHRLAALPLDGTPSHRGELRSPLRAHLLPGVTSARTWIKQRDFENCRALERYADPLAALAHVLGRGAAGLDAFLEMAWRTEIQNHPHDSICGCSVDQVHLDMRYRFDQVAMLAETATRRAAAACFNPSNADASAVAVFNPSFARLALASGEIELADPAARYAIETPDGNRIPVAIDVVRKQRAGRCIVNFIAPDLVPVGFSFYRLVRDDSRAASSTPDQGASIETEFFRLTPTARGLEIRDPARDTAMELYFEDDGDRGDEYNFDPVRDSAPIATPAAISAGVIDQDPLRKRIKLTMTFEVPTELSADRHERSPHSSQLEVVLTATLYQGLDRADFVAEVSTGARDHRLRAALRTPIVATDAVHDTSFGVVKRPLVPSEPPGTQDIYPTVPHRTFTAVESAVFSAAIASRGILEVEARPERYGSTILLTLLRCVGWLSRSDLATRRGGAGPELETPDAQELGEHRFEFAVATFRGDYFDGGLLQRVEAYTSPPRIFPAAATIAIPPPSHCSDAIIRASSSRPRALWPAPASTRCVCIAHRRRPKPPASPSARTPARGSSISPHAQ